MNNFEICIPRRPRGFIEQFNYAILNTNKEWILFIDDDAKLTRKTKEIIFNPYFWLISKHDIVRFKWINSENRKIHGIGFYRVSAVKKIISWINLPSMGMDAILEKLLPTVDSQIFEFTHPLKTNFKTYFRWGRGRAQSFRITKSTELPIDSMLNIQYLNLYIGYLLGFIYGLIANMNDEPF